MKVYPFLADAAQVESGKVGALGLGWSTCPTPIPPFALVVFVDIELDELRPEYHLRFDLLDENGDQVVLPGPDGPTAISLELKGQVQVRGEHRKGTQVRWPVAVNVQGAIPLEPGRYGWRVSVAEHEADAALAWFEVLDAPSMNVVGKGPVFNTPSTPT